MTFKTWYRKVETIAASNVDPDWDLPVDNIEGWNAFDWQACFDAEWEPQMAVLEFACEHEDMFRAFLRKNGRLR